MTHIERNAIGSVRPFLPHEPGLRAHVQRVAILAGRAAAHGGCSTNEIEQAVIAGLLHHYDSDEADGAVKLWAALGVDGRQPDIALSVNARNALHALRNPAKDDCGWASLVDAANLFDEQMENLPYDDLTTEAAVQELWMSGMIPDAFADALASFRVVSQGQLKAVLEQLPPIDLSAEPEEMFRSWWGSKRSDSLQFHSATVADAALKNAREAHEARPSNAYLAGLLHDLGRVAYRESEVVKDLRYWEGSGFPLTYAEFLISGTDHATLGADWLRGQGISEPIAEAVEFHHRPELTESRLAAVLYLAEEIDESLPSCARDHMSAKRLSTPATSQARAAGRV